MFSIISIVETYVIEPILQSRLFGSGIVFKYVDEFYDYCTEFLSIFKPEVFYNFIGGLFVPLLEMDIFFPCPHGYISVCDIYNTIDYYKDIILRPWTFFDHDMYCFTCVVLVILLTIIFGVGLYCADIFKFNLKIPYLTKLKNCTWGKELKSSNEVIASNVHADNNSSVKLQLTRRRLYFQKLMSQQAQKLLCGRIKSLYTITYLRRRRGNMCVDLLNFLQWLRGFERIYVLRRLVNGKLVKLPRMRLRRSIKKAQMKAREISPSKNITLFSPKVLTRTKTSVTMSPKTPKSPKNVPLPKCPTSPAIQRSATKTHPITKSQRSLQIMQLSKRVLTPKQSRRSPARKASSKN